MAEKIYCEREGKKVDTCQVFLKDEEGNLGTDFAEECKTCIVYKSYTTEEKRKVEWPMYKVTKDDIVRYKNLKEKTKGTKYTAAPAPPEEDDDL